MRINWKKNSEIVEKYNVKRSLTDMILPILITTVVCYVLSLLITLISGYWFVVKAFVDNVQRVSGFGVALSLLAFAPRIHRAKYISQETNLKEEYIYTRSELRAQLSQIDIIVLIGSLLAIFTSLLLYPLY